MTSAPRSASVVVMAPGPSIEHSTMRMLPSGAGVVMRVGPIGRAVNQVQAS